MRDTNINFIPSRFPMIWNHITQMLMQKKAHFPPDPPLTLDAHGESIWEEKLECYPRWLWNLMSLAIKFWQLGFSSICFHVFLRLLFQLTHQVFHIVKGQLGSSTNTCTLSNFLPVQFRACFHLDEIKHCSLYTKRVHTLTLLKNRY